MIFDPIIYEEEIDVYESELALEKAINKSNYLIDLIYFENTNTKSNEKIIDRIINTFKAFINKCLNYIKNAIKKIHDRIIMVYTEHKLKKILHDFSKKVDHAEKRGLKTFTFINIDTIYKIIKKECDIYEKEIKNFTKSYIKHASPKDAEKLLLKFNLITEEYDNTIKELINTPKEFTINEAKSVIRHIENCKDKNGNVYTNILDRHYKMCEEVEKLTEAVLMSLNKYSEDTGYIQNAKTLQQMIHNSCIRLHVHASECMTALLKYGIPIMVHIDKLYNTKDIYIGEDKDGIPVYRKTEVSSKSHKELRNTGKRLLEYIGDVTNAEIKSIRKVQRKNDIKDWKFTKGESPLSFDNREVTAGEAIAGAHKAIPYIALKTAAMQHDINKKH